MLVFTTERGYLKIMPVYLAPWSRRRFLSATLAATAGLVAGCGALSSRTPRDPNAVALLSDIHIDADPEKLARGINMTQHLNSVSKELMELPQRPAQVFITGDLAYNSGQPGDYRQVARLLEPMRAAGHPLRLAMGNHDQRDRFWAEFESEKAAKRPVKDRQTMLVSTPAANWLLLDSLDKTNSTPGLLGKAQLEWLAGALDASPSKPAIILLHHNPGLQENMGLKDTAPLFEVIRPRRQVKAYIYGHTHTWKVLQDSSGIHLINLPAVAYVFRENEPAGWVHAQTRRSGIRLELRCIDPKHPAHGQVQELTWRT